MKHLLKYCLSCIMVCLMVCYSLPLESLAASVLGSKNNPYTLTASVSRSSGKSFYGKKGNSTWIKISAFTGEYDLSITSTSSMSIKIYSKSMTGQLKYKSSYNASSKVVSLSGYRTTLYIEIRPNYSSRNVYVSVYPHQDSTYGSRGGTWKPNKNSEYPYRTTTTCVYDYRIDWYTADQVSSLISLVESDKSWSILAGARSLCVNTLFYYTVGMSYSAFWDKVKSKYFAPSLANLITNITKTGKYSKDYAIKIIAGAGVLFNSLKSEYLNFKSILQKIKLNQLKSCAGYKNSKGVYSRGVKIIYRANGSTFASLIFSCTSWTGSQMIASKGYRGSFTKT